MYEPLMKKYTPFTPAELAEQERAARQRQDAWLSGQEPPRSKAPPATHRRVPLVTVQRRWPMHNNHAVGFLIIEMPVDCEWRSVLIGAGGRWWQYSWPDDDGWETTHEHAVWLTGVSRDFFLQLTSGQAHFTDDKLVQRSHPRGLRPRGAARGRVRPGGNARRNVGAPGDNQRNGAGRKMTCVHPAHCGDGPVIRGPL